jgi:predicted MFS family arabinose efflux permease
MSTAAAADDYLFGRSTTIKVFSLFCLMMILDFADRMIIAALLPAIKAEWHISDAQAGMLGSALFVGMVVFALPAAIAIDRWSRVKTAALMGAFWSLASGAGALAQNITQLVVTRAAVGIGEAGYTPAATAWIMAAFPKRRVQLAIGTFSAGQPIGMALGVAVGGYIASHYGWRHALGVMALPGILLAVLLYRARDYRNVPVAPTSASMPRAKLTSSLGAIFRTPSLVGIYLNSAMVVMQMASVFYFLPTYLNRVHGVALERASYMSSFAVLVGIVAAPMGGWLIDALSARDVRAKLGFPLLTSLITMLLFITAFGWADTIELQYGLVLAAVFCLIAGGSGPSVVTQELVPPDTRALSMTCNALAAHLLGSVPGPLLTGAISDRSSLGFALLCVTVLAGLVSVSALWMARRRYLEDLARVPATVLIAR